MRTKRDYQPGEERKFPTPRLTQSRSTGSAWSSPEGAPPSTEAFERSLPNKSAVAIREFSRIRTFVRAREASTLSLPFAHLFGILSKSAVYYPPARSWPLQVTH